MHIRRKILEDIRTQLKALSDIGGVWIQRVAPSRAAYPAITLYSESETVEILTIHTVPRPQERVLNVSIVVWISNTPDDEKSEYDMDAFALLVEQTVRTPTNAIDCYLTATSFQFSEDDATLSAVTLTYTIIYETIEFSPVV
jgi:hypothetical protein